MTPTNSRYTALTLTELEAEEAALQVALEAVRGRVSPWLPIESAPKDGTVILLSETERGEAKVFAAEFNEDWGLFTVHIDGAPLFPTHWMPLPPAPLAGEA